MKFVVIALALLMSLSAQAEHSLTLQEPILLNQVTSLGTDEELSWETPKEDPENTIEKEWNHYLTSAYAKVSKEKEQYTNYCNKQWMIDELKTYCINQIEKTLAANAGTRSPASESVVYIDDTSFWMYMDQKKN